MTLRKKLSQLCLPQPSYSWRSAAVLALMAGTIGLSADPALAQTETSTDTATDEPSLALDPITTEGIANTLDKKSRGPILTVQEVHRPGRVTLLVDVAHRRDDLKPYPFQIDYYINRQHFTSQFRSPELTGALGVDIGSDVAVPPFNYAIVAKVLHPNNIWTTVAQGAAYPQDLDGGAAAVRYDCDLERGEEIAIGENLRLVTTGTNTYSLSIEDSDSELEAATVSLTIVDGSGSGTVTFGDDEPISITGELAVDSSGQIESVDMTNEDEDVNLLCSQVETDDDDTNDDSDDDSDDESGSDQADNTNGALEQIFTTTLEFD